MKKPRNTTGLFAFILNALGIVYLGLGLLVMRNVITSTGDVEDVSGQLIAIGLIFLVAGLIVLGCHKVHQEVLKSLPICGDKVSGSVVDVYMLKYMHWGMMCPYVVKYTFEYGGKTYTSKSELIWQVPTAYPGDVITILVDKKHPKTSVPMDVVAD